MQLREYIRRENLTIRDAAVRFRLSRSTVHRLLALDRVRQLSRSSAERIYRETGGAVCPNDLFGLHPPKAPAVNGVSIGSRIKRLFGLEARA